MTSFRVIQEGASGPATWMCRLTIYDADDPCVHLCLFEHPGGSFVLPHDAKAEPLYHLFLALQQYYGEGQ